MIRAAGESELREAVLTLKDASREPPLACECLAVSTQLSRHSKKPSQPAFPHKPASGAKAGNISSAVLRLRLRLHRKDVRVHCKVRP